MSRNTTRLIALTAALLTGACGGGGSNGDTWKSVASPACQDPSAAIAITDETNYSMSNSFEIETSVVKDHTNLVFDWSGLTKDFFGKTMDPAKDVNLVLVSLWKMTPSEIKEALKKDELPLSAVIGAITSYPDGTYTKQNLLDFTELGNPLPEEEFWKRFDTSNPAFGYPQDRYTFMFMASSGTVPGKHARMLSLFTIDPGASQTTLALTNDSTKLDFTVNLKDATHVQVPTETPALTIGWKQLTKNSLGNQFFANQITQAAVAHFASETISDLEDDFLRLNDMADGWWSGEIDVGTSIDLSQLKNDDGESFPGTDSNGVWLLALFCTANCNNPAPWSITFLDPCK